MPLRSSSCKRNNNNSPPWQVLVLVANVLDPKTLATASCVSKSWLLSMSSDHLWNPICSAQFPSLSALRLAGPNASYRRIYALGRASAKRRLRSPPNPLISLRDLMFTVDVHTNNGASVLTVAKPGAELVSDPEGVFRFDLDVRDEEYSLVAEELKGLRVTWNVVLGGLEGVFTMMECRGKGSFVPGPDGWFSKELPSPGCCSGAAVSGLVADLWLGLRRLEGPDGGGSGKVVGLEKVGVGVLSAVSWRYVGLDDALRYLQHFLMPSSV